MKDRDDTERAQRFSHFTIERAPDAIFWIDSEGVIYRVNEAACRMLGYSVGALTGMKVYDLSPDDDIEEYRVRWAKTRDAGLLHYEWQFINSAGELVPVEILRNYIEFEGKGYSCSFVRDISERKAMEHSLQEAYADVERLKDRLQRENIYLQHEIKLTHNFGEIIGRSRGIKSMLA